MEFRLILASDDGDHLLFLPLVSAAWRKFFDLKISLIIVGDIFMAERYRMQYGQYVDEIKVVPLLDEIRVMNQAKMARLWYTGRHGSDVCLVNDMDLIPLQRKYYAGVIADHKPDTMLLVGGEVYASVAHERGKFPMGATTAESYLWQEIANPNDLPYLEWLRSFYGLHVIDNREDPKGEDCCFSDESLMRVLLLRWARRGTHADHRARGYYWLDDTVDRARWDLLDVKKLHAGGYYESHMLKPFSENKDRLQVLADYIGITL